MTCSEGTRSHYAERCSRVDEVIYRESRSQTTGIIDQWLFSSLRVPNASESESESSIRPILGGVRSKYPGPRHAISRDQSLTWWRRVLPVIQSHRVTFVTAMSFRS